MKNITIEAAGDVLDAWTVFEVLSPQSFRKLEDLVAGNRKLIFSLDKPYLPWEITEEEKSKNSPIIYQLIIGTINFSKVISALFEKFSGNSLDKTTTESSAIIAVILIDKNGYLLKSLPNTIISSFAWGIRKVLDKDFKALADWTIIEQSLASDFSFFLQRKDKNNNDLPITKQVIEEAYQYFITKLGLPEEMTDKTYFAIKSDPSKTVLLNSFYLNDLITAKNTVLKNAASRNLKQYLGIEVVKDQYNILTDYSSLEETVSPKLTPAARWPSVGRHPLVLLQQAAVNIALNKLKDGGILGINGPPGTGKTTLLRDIVAGLVTQKAEAMCSFDNPSDAFTDTLEKVKVGHGWLNIYQLDKRLKGFEILIASSNNKAVENVSFELPSLKAIAKDANELRYFSALSDKLLGTKSWGLIAAALGNSTNCKNFVNIFWWDNDVSIATYLAQVCGIPQMFDVKDPISSKIIETRVPQIVQENDPPRNHQQALQRWNQARAKFQAILKQTNAKLAELENVRSLFKYLDSLDDEEIDLEKLSELLLQHKSLRPNLLARIFKPFKSYSWKKQQIKLDARKNDLDNADKYRNLLRPHIIEKQLFLNNSELQQLSPWCDQEIQLLRDKVFIAAIKLQKAFIDAAANPLRHNLGIFMQHLTRPTQFYSEQKNFISDLWSSFFLVVPCISTTFASIDRMLVDMPQESLGWLLIDEAGQATPQAAVGAIMRTKRAIVVGDPMQIEPVVLLPNNLTQTICKHFGIDPYRYNSPSASAQTLADEATSYFTKFHGKYGSRPVGMPLLVHRRCSEPMFDIANVICL